MAFSISLIMAPIIGFQIANWLGYDFLFYFLAGAGLLLVLGFGGLKRWMKTREIGDVK